MKEPPATPSTATFNQAHMRLVTRIEARQRLGNISDDKFYGLIRCGDLPPPIKLGTSSRWLESDLDAFITSLAADRKAPQAPAGIRAHHAKLAAHKKHSAGHTSPPKMGAEIGVKP